MKSFRSEYRLYELSAYKILGKRDYHSVLSEESFIIFAKDDQEAETKFYRDIPRTRLMTNLERLTYQGKEDAINHIDSEVKNGRLSWGLAIKFFRYQSQKEKNFENLLDQVVEEIQRSVSRTD